MVVAVAAGTAAGLRADKPDAANLIAEAKEALSKGKPKQALDIVQKAVTSDPKNSRVYLLRAAIYDNLEKYDLAVSDCTRALELDPKGALAYDQRGTAYFKLGQIAKSVADFDRFVDLRPAEKPKHWRRGIALYYAGRFEDGQKQFEGYQSVDANDVENVVWRYLCMARQNGPAKARAAMLKIGKDRRVPMMEIYALFCGRAQPTDVLAAAKADNSQREALFYAHLYLGLYYESEGNAKEALEHLTCAVDLRIGHYMWQVARVHRDLLLKKTN